MLLIRWTNAITAQVLTAHCFHKIHQHRLGFLSSASCSCGAPVESLPQFLFHCPIYSAHRTLLVEAVNSSNIPWPTSSIFFCKSNLLWNSVFKFFLRTKRLARGKPFLRWSWVERQLEFRSVLFRPWWTLSQQDKPPPNNVHHGCLISVQRMCDVCSSTQTGAAPRVATTAPLRVIQFYSAFRLLALHNSICLHP